MDLQLLDYEAAHSFVDNAGPDVWWDNYDIIVWSYNPVGFFNKHGFYKRNKSGGGKWGTVRRIKVNNAGQWKVNVETNRRVRA